MWILEKVRMLEVFFCIYFKKQIKNKKGLTHIEWVKRKNNNKTYCRKKRYSLNFNSYRIVIDIFENIIKPQIL